MLDHLPETRRLIVPEALFAEKMLRQARIAFTHLAADQATFLRTIEEARIRWAWTKDVSSDKFTFWHCCDALGLDPEDTRERMLARLDDDMRKIVVGRLGFKCPLCSRIKADP